MTTFAKIFVIISIAGGVLFSACNHKNHKVGLATEDTLVPDLSMDSAVIRFTDSTILKIKVKAREINYFSSNKEPYTEFPKGMKVLFYDSKQEVTSSIEADYAINYEKKELWKATGNVIAVNNKGDKLKTEEMFWDQKKHLIYSNKFSKISTADGTYFGKEGFEADENMDHWVLKGSSGTVNVKTDEEFQ